MSRVLRLGHKISPRFQMFFFFFLPQEVQYEVAVCEGVRLWV